MSDIDDLIDELRIFARDKTAFEEDFDVIVRAIDTINELRRKNTAVAAVYVHTREDLIAARDHARSAALEEAAMAVAGTYYSPESPFTPADDIRALMDKRI